LANLSLLRHRFRHWHFEEPTAEQLKVECAITWAMSGKQRGGPKTRARKPPKRPELPRPGGSCTIDSFCLEVGWGDTVVRAWFVTHPDGTSVEGHGEEMHRGAHRSMRLYPAGRDAFNAAHKPKK
jgi:hypothetical protein